MKYNRKGHWEERPEAPPREVPMLFSPEMVRAILEKKKQVTRRVKLKPSDRPRWKQDDILWVRENYKVVFESFTDASCWFGVDYVLRRIDVNYPADNETRTFIIDNKQEKRDRIKLYRYRWDSVFPSIHMPRWACRLFLRVYDVQEKKLWDMDDRAAQYEGFDNLNHFKETWNDLYELRGFGWEKNPTVYVTSFSPFNFLELIENLKKDFRAEPPRLRSPEDIR